ncbi:MAG: hypothetical protein AAFX02_06805 [Pseudomonadota bacterium]
MISPALFNVILVLIVFEAVFLGLFLRQKSKQYAIPALTSFLLSGAFLMAALRVAIQSDFSELFLQILLALSFFAHVATLFFAWRIIRDK